MREDWNYYQGDIYLADLEKSIGSEQSGIRPVIVVQNNVGNRYAPTLTVVPLTSNMEKHDLPTHYYLWNGKGLPKDSVVLGEQISTIDKERILLYMGKVTKTQMRGIERVIRIHLGFQRRNYYSS